MKLLAKIGWNVSSYAGNPSAPSQAAPRVGDNGRVRWRYLVLVAAALSGMTTSYAMYATIKGWQAHLEDIRFTSAASDYLQNINHGLEDATDLLYSLRAYFESSDHLPTREEFQAYSSSLRRRVPGLRDTGWAPRIRAAERDAFERAIQASGFPDFEIKARGADNTLVREGNQTAYFPILYSDPGPPNRPVMGFNLTSETMRRQAIGRAVASDRPAATPPVKLMNGKRPNGGIMSFIPVRLNRAGDSDPTTPVDGIILGAFETAPMIENLLATQARRVGLDMYVFDPDAPPGNRLIYWHSTNGNPPPAEDDLTRTRHWQGTLELVDQRWGAIFIPSDGSTGGTDWTAVMVLVTGLLMTLMLVIYLWVSHRRTVQLETMTANLRRLTEELRHNGRKLDHMARHDALTGLANRTAFRQEVATDLRQVPDGLNLAVLYLDLDRFKAVNDSLGHPAGDQLLCAVAERLRATVREADIITRLGGDEFAIAQVGGEQPTAAEALARRLLETISRPYEIDGQWVAVGVSVGITLATSENADVDELLRQADIALYAAKRHGRGTWRFFASAMDIDAQSRLGLEISLRDALEREEFLLYYQPQVSLRDGRVTGFEALLRWNHPDRGLILPGDFIRCAEETGLIMPIGAWALRTALRDAASWPDGIRVAINISPHQLARDGMLEAVEAALAESGQPGSRLELEITENALREQYIAGQTALRRLRELGVLISMDDFGTGYASLSHLRSFPFDRIKVDQSFVSGMCDTPQAGAIVRAILQLADTLEIVTVAEGVETQAQRDQLVAFGCDEAQGFFFSRPLPAIFVPRILSDLSTLGNRLQS